MRYIVCGRSIFLSVTFGRPCIAPDRTHLLEDVVLSSWVWFGDPLHARQHPRMHDVNKASLGNPLISGFPGAQVNRADGRHFPLVILSHAC